jgi:RNA polymerase sigma factor (sigma-70 family)
MEGNLRSLTDSVLEGLASGGDREAFGQLYERHSGRVYDFLLRMVRDPEEAADLMQETFVRSMRSLSKEKSGSASFSTWLFTIARNLAITRLERRRRTVPLVHDEGEDREGVDNYQVIDEDRFANPEEASGAREVAGLVWQAAAALDPKQYSLLDLHVRQGLDSAEIASVLGISKGNAYSMLSRLKDAFEDAVASFIMFRHGRRYCSELDRIVGEYHVAEMSASARKIISRHTAECTTCQEQRRRLVSAEAILRSFVPLSVPWLLKQRIAEASMQAGLAAKSSAGTHAASSSLDTPAEKSTHGEQKVESGHQPDPGSESQDASEAGSASPSPQARTGDLIALKSKSRQRDKNTRLLWIYIGGRLSQRPTRRKVLLAAALFLALLGASVAGWLMAQDAEDPKAAIGSSAETPVSGVLPWARTPKPTQSPSAGPTVEPRITVAATATAQPATVPSPLLPTLRPPPQTPVPPPPTPLPVTFPPFLLPPEYACAEIRQSPSGETEGFNSQLEQEIVDLQNYYRAGQGLPPLQYDSRLAAVARGFAQQLVENDWVGDHLAPGNHTGPDGRTLLDRLRDGGLVQNRDFYWAAENYAWGIVAASPCSVFTGFAHEHLCNIAGDRLYSAPRGYYQGIGCYFRYAPTLKFICVMDYAALK